MKQQNFAQTLSVLKGSRIGLLLRNNQFMEVTLLDVKLDHIIVDMSDHIFYIALSHIQALSKNAKDLHVTSKSVPYLDRIHLIDLLDALKYNWVTINSVNNQTYNGLLSNISDDYIMLINGVEILYIPKSSISNIYKGIYEFKEQQDNTSNTDEEEVVLDSPSFTDNLIEETADSPAFSRQGEQGQPIISQSRDNQKPLSLSKEPKKEVVTENTVQEEDDPFISHQPVNMESEDSDKHHHVIEEIKLKDNVVLDALSSVDPDINETEVPPTFSHQEEQDHQPVRQSRDNQKPLSLSKEPKKEILTENTDQEEDDPFTSTHQPVNEEKECSDKHHDEDQIKMKENLVLDSLLAANQDINEAEVPPAFSRQEEQDHQPVRQSRDNQKPLSLSKEPKKEILTENTDQEEDDPFTSTHQPVNEEKECSDKHHDEDQIKMKENLVLDSLLAANQDINEAEVPPAFSRQEEQDHQPIGQSRDNQKPLSLSNEPKKELVTENTVQEEDDPFISHQPVNEERECSDKHHDEGQIKLKDNVVLDALSSVNPNINEAEVPPTFSRQEEQKGQPIGQSRDNQKPLSLSNEPKKEVMTENTVQEKIDPFISHQSVNIESEDSDKNHHVIEEIKLKDNVVLDALSSVDPDINETEVPPTFSHQEEQDHQPVRQSRDNQKPLSLSKEPKKEVVTENTDQEENDPFISHQSVNMESEDSDKHHLRIEEIKLKNNVVLDSPSSVDQDIIEAEVPPTFSHQEEQDHQPVSQSSDKQRLLTNRNKTKQTILKKTILMKKPDQEEKRNPPTLPLGNPESKSIENQPYKGNQNDDFHRKREVVLDSPSSIDQEITEPEDQLVFSPEEVQIVQPDLQTNGNQKASKSYTPNHQRGNQENEQEEYYYEYIEWHNGTMVKKKLFWSFHR